LRANFIPIALRDALLADAAKAEEQRDLICADRLRQIANYDGEDAPRRVRELGVQACEVRYQSARELMRLVRLAEEEQPRSLEVRS
jgi:hypothetical protein